MSPYLLRFICKVVWHFMNTPFATNLFFLLWICVALKECMKNHYNFIFRIIKSFHKKVWHCLKIADQYGKTIMFYASLYWQDHRIDWRNKSNFTKSSMSKIKFCIYLGWYFVWKKWKPFLTLLQKLLLGSVIIKKFVETRIFINTS